MKAHIILGILGVLVGACGQAEPPSHPEPDAHWGTKADVLTTEAGMMMTALAAMDPEPLAHKGICDSNGLCGQSAGSAFQELARYGLVARSAGGDYVLTSAGTDYVDSHWEVTRQGDFTTVSRRDTHE